MVKTQEQLVRMQENLRVAMASLQASGAPPAAIERIALSLASADDVLSWVLGKPSELARLEDEYNLRREEADGPQKPYYKTNTGSLPWCATHRRFATHLLVREGMEDEPHCDPKLGGITMPCITTIKLGNAHNE